MNSTAQKDSAYVIGIAGPSGSGKSFFAERIRAALPAKDVLILSQDYYYKDRSEISLEQRQTINYDHPEAIDFALLISHLQALKQGLRIEHPLYDFAMHNRKRERMPAGPARVVIVDGILLYAVPDLCRWIDFKVYIDTPLDICFIRRLQRDRRERGRSEESVIDQYLTTVRPMFAKFVLPGKKLADLVVVGLGDMEPGLRYVLKTLPYSSLPRENRGGST